MEKVRADKDELNLPHSKEVEECLKSIDPEKVRRYEKQPGLTDLLAKRHNVDPKQIFLENGVIGIIHRIFDSLNGESKVLLPELGYPYYHTLALHQKVNLSLFKFQKDKSEFSYDIDDLLKKLKKGPELLVLIDPESPFGFSLPEKDLQIILKATTEDQLVILDQTYEGFRSEHVKDVAKLIDKFPNLLVARSFSKFYGLAGLRIGFALCGKKVKKMINFKDKYLGFDNIAQEVAIAALNSEQHYQENAIKIDKEKQRIIEEIEGSNGYEIYNTDTNSLVVRVPQTQKELLEKQANNSAILIRHLGDYHPELENMYRVTMGPKEHTDRIIDLFRSISWLHSMRIFNCNEKQIINTRDEGYTVNRFEFPCEKSNLLMGVMAVIIPPGKKVPMHSHKEQDELFEFHSKAHILINEQEFEVRAGDMVNIKPNDVHESKAPSDRFTRYICFRFPYSLSDKYLSSGEQIIHEGDVDENATEKKEIQSGNL